MLSLIVAHDLKFGIGKNNQLPWNLTKELNNFKNITISKKYKNVTSMTFRNSSWFFTITPNNIFNWFIQILEPIANEGKAKETSG